MSCRTDRPLLMTLTLSVLVAATGAAQAPSSTGKTLNSVEAKLLRYDTAGARADLEPVFAEQDARHQLAMGDVLEQEQRYGLAAGHYRKATELAPSDPATYVSLGETLVRKSQGRDPKETAEAKAAFDRARVVANRRLATHPTHFRSAYYLGLALRGLRRYPAAIEKLTAAKALRPQSPLVIFDLGVTHAYAQQWQPAVDALTIAIDRNPGIAYAYYFRGMAAGKIDRKDLMINDFDRFLTLAPNAPEAPRVRRVLDAARR